MLGIVPGMLGMAAWLFGNPPSYWNREGKEGEMSGLVEARERVD